MALTRLRGPIFYRFMGEDFSLVIPKLRRLRIERGRTVLLH